MNPRVGDVKARDDYKLEITFTNGEVGLFDCAHPGRNSLIVERQPRPHGLREDDGNHSAAGGR